MAIKFYKLNVLLDQKDMSKGDLQEAIKVSSATVAKLFNHEYISLAVVDKICQALDCQPGDFIEYVKED